MYFTHSPQRWNHGSTDGLFILFLLLLHTCVTMGPALSMRSCSSYKCIIKCDNLQFGP